MSAHSNLFRLPDIADLERCRLVSALVGRPIYAANPILLLEEEELEDLRYDLVRLLPSLDCEGLQWFLYHDNNFFDLPDLDVWPQILVERVDQVINEDAMENLSMVMKIAVKDGGGDACFAKMNFHHWFNRELQTEVDYWRWVVRQEAERRFPRYTPFD